LAAYQNALAKINIKQMFTCIALFWGIILRYFEFES